MPRQDAPPETDPLASFRTWRGFFFVAVAVNLLFIYGMAALTSDAGAAWIKALSWLPFNAITTVLYYVFMKKLGGGIFPALCIAMIVLNWAAYFAA